MSSPFPKVIPLPSKSISMHAASCDRVVLVLGIFGAAIFEQQYQTFGQSLIFNVVF